MRNIINWLCNYGVLNNGAKYRISMSKVDNITKKDYEKYDFISYDNNRKSLKEFMTDEDCAFLMDLISNLANTDTGGVFVNIVDEDLSNENIFLLLTLRYVSISKKYDSVKEIIFRDFTNFYRYFSSDSAYKDGSQMYTMQ